jgi:translation elongation factor EF-1alpha
MCNIVCFGHAGSGKSTLIGYLFSRYDENFDENKHLVDMQKKLGSAYKPDMFYSYIISNYKDESSGHTAHAHAHRINLPFDRITIIDTPGVSRFDRERKRGMFLGNVGVFCIEITDALDDKLNTTILSPLLLWTKLSESQNTQVIILLTKFDKCNYDYNDFLKARDIIKRECSCILKKNKEPDVFPVAIDVDERTSYNVIDGPEETEIKGIDTFVDALEKTVKSIARKIEADQLLFKVNAEFSGAGDSKCRGVGKVWQIKIICGALKIDDQIVLAPVKDTNNNLVSVQAAIKTIRLDSTRSEEHEPVNQAYEGSLVGIDLYNCRIEGRKVNKQDFTMISSTCGFLTESKYDISENFCFKSPYKDVFIKGKDFLLIWFGRTISFKVKGVKSIENDNVKVCASLLSKSKQLAMPLDINNNADGEYLFSLLTITNTIQKNKDRRERFIPTPQFYEGKLIKIGFKDDNCDNCTADGEYSYYDK